MFSFFYVHLDYVHNNIDLNLVVVEHIVDNYKQDNNYHREQHDDEIDDDADDDDVDDDDHLLYKYHHHHDLYIPTYNPFFHFFFSQINLDKHDFSETTCCYSIIIKEKFCFFVLEIN